MRLTIVLSATIQRLLPKSSFARGVSVVTSGTVAGQLIVVLSSPVLTRIYTPEQFGALAIYVALLGIVAVVAGLNYEVAIPLPRSDKKAAIILTLTMICVILVTIISTGLVFFLKEFIAEVTKIPQLEFYLWLLPVGVALRGAYQTFTFWAIRTKEFSRLAKTKVQQGAAMAVSQIGFGIAELGAIGLIVGQVIGLSAGLSGLYKTFHTRVKSIDKLVSPTHIIKVAKRYRRFPVYGSWGALINAVGNQLPPLALAILFSPAAAGFYVIAQRVGSRPLVLIGDAVRNVFFPNAAIAKRQGNLADITSKAFSSLLCVGALPIATLAFIAPDLFSVVFGVEWSQAGIYLRWLSPWLVAQFVVSPLAGIFDVLERQVHGLVLQGVLLAARLLSFAAGAYYDSVILALALFGLSSAAAFVLFGSWAFHLAGVNIRTLLAASIREFFIVISVLAVLSLISVIIDLAFTEAVSFIQILSATVVAVPIIIWRIRVAIR